MVDYDLAIIGGGINGAGIARDAAGRGLRVLLVEQDDLASATSLGHHQADPRRPALSRALRVPAGARGLSSANCCSHGAAHHAADALRPAARPAAAALVIRARPVPL